MSCYAHSEDPRRFVDIFNRTVEPVVGRCRLSTHLCFGNYKGRAVGPRRYAPMFPDFLDLHVDEMHLEMASREFAEIELIGTIAAADGRGGRHHRREELLRRNARGRGRARAAVPEARAGRAAVVRARLRPEPDGALGGAAEAGEHGGGSGEGATRAGSGLNSPVGPIGTCRVVRA